MADQIKSLDWRVRDAEWICTLPPSGSGRGIAETWYIAIMIKTCDKSNFFEEIEKLLAMKT